MNQKLYKLFKMLAKFESVTSVDGVTMELPNGLNVDSEVFVENEEFMFSFLQVRGLKIVTLFQ